MAATARHIYFAGSIRGGRTDAELYGRIINHLQRYGTVLTEHVGDPNLKEEDSTGEKTHKDGYIHDRDIEWLQRADVLVAEVTQPSLGVGYEIGRAVEMRKRILCLFRPESGKRLSAMIRGAQSKDNNCFTVKDYTEDQVATILQEYFQQTP